MKNKVHLEPDPRADSVAWAYWYRTTQQTLASVSEIAAAWRRGKLEWALLDQMTK